MPNVSKTKQHDVCCTKETSAMKTISQILMLAAVGTLTGCGANPSDGTEASAQTTSSTKEAVTVIDCQRQVGTCVKAAKKFTDLAACTTGFASCTAQAAADAVDQPNLLANCRSKADSCLKGAVTLTDISSCRSVYEACASDVTSTAGDALKDAVGAAQSIITAATNAAAGVIGDATGATGAALDALSACTAKANQCLDGALSVSDVTPCQDVFETCVSNAVTLVNKVTSELPVPTPAQIASDLSACQASSVSCLDGALSVSDISSCKTTLQTCVSGATTVVDTAVGDVNKLLPPGVSIPAPSKALNCTTAATNCLLQLGNPLDCANKAAQCLAAP
jgi:hypothetical protein